MPSETVTFGLAVFGATTGAAAAMAQVYSVAVDRPRLATNFGVTTRANGKPSLYIEVTNLGRRATTVRQAGFYAGKHRIEVIRQGETEPHLRGEAEVIFQDGPLFIEAGRSARIEIVPNIESFGIHADYPMRAYAMDIKNRRIWGDAAPVVRMLVGHDPPLDGMPTDFAALFVPRSDLKPAKVEPRWKVWKRRELRDPRAWSL